MKPQAIALALLACLAHPSRADDIADWWQAYATDTRLVTLPDGKQLSLLCMGEGTPVVMMDAGLGVVGMKGGRKVQGAIGRLTRTCAYDRAGIANSAPTDGPRDAGTEADEFAALLQAAELPAPYVLVAASYGGFIARLYASRHTSDVAGLLLIDPSSAYQADRFVAAIPDIKSLLDADDALAKDCAIDPRPADLVMRCGRTPPVDMPSDMSERWITSLGPAHANHVAREREAWNALSSKLLDQEKKSLGAIPFVVLNRDSTRLPTRGSAEQAMTYERVWLQMHVEIMDLSSDSELHIVPGAGHDIQLDKPDAVINAVTDMVRKVRGNK